jgi:hypothetical protein
MGIADTIMGMLMVFVWIRFCFLIWFSFLRFGVPFDAMVVSGGPLDVMAVWRVCHWRSLILILGVLSDLLLGLSWFSLATRQALVGVLPSHLRRFS